jgi:hypothetical protein
VTWAKLDDLFPTNRKVSRLSDAAFRLYVTALCYAAQHLTDGVVSVDGLVKVRATAVSELIMAGLFEETDRGLEIHDFLHFNPSRESVEAKRGEKHAAKVAGGKARAERARRDEKGRLVRPPEKPAAIQQPAGPPAGPPAGQSAGSAGRFSAGRSPAASQQASSPVPSPPSLTGNEEVISEGADPARGFCSGISNEGPPSLGPLRRRDPTRWPAILEVLRARLDPRDFRSWFADSHELEIEALTVEVPSPAFVDEITRRWGFEIVTAACGPVVLISGDARSRLAFALEPASAEPDATSEPARSGP